MSDALSTDFRGLKEATGHTLGGVMWLPTMFKDNVLYLSDCLEKDFLNSTTPRSSLIINGIIATVFSKSDKNDHKGRSRETNNVTVSV